MTKEQTTTSKRLLTIQETAEVLGLAPRTIYNAVAPKAKKPFPIRPKRIGRKILFDIRDIEIFLQGL